MVSFLWSVFQYVTIKDYRYTQMNYKIMIQITSNFLIWKRNECFKRNSLYNFIWRVSDDSLIWKVPQVHQYLCYHNKACFQIASNSISVLIENSLIMWYYCHKLISSFIPRVDSLIMFRILYKLVSSKMIIIVSILAISWYWALNFLLVANLIWTRFIAVSWFRTLRII